MSRSYLSLTIVLAIAAAALGTGAPLAVAQPTISTTMALCRAQAEGISGSAEGELQLLSNRQVEEAVKELREESRKNPELPTEYVMMYRILAQANQPNAARFWLERGVVENPSDPEPWVILGSIALNDNRMAESEIDFAKAKQLLATYPTAERKGVIDQLTMSGQAQVGAKRRAARGGRDPPAHVILEGGPQRISWPCSGWPAHCSGKPKWMTPTAF